MRVRESLQYLNQEFKVVKSELQLTLEAQGCRFSSQELLSAHEVNPDEPCPCGRPNNTGANI